MYRHEPSFQVDGIASGYQTKALLDASSQKLEGPIKKTLQGYDTAVHQIECLKDLLRDVNGLRNVTSTTVDATMLAAPAVSSSVPDISGQASEFAVMGAYTLNVVSVASAQRTYSDPWQSQLDPDSGTYKPTQPLASGTFTLTLGSGQSFSMAIGNGVAQSDVASGVIGAGLSISAQVIDDQAQSPPQQTLLFAGLADGANYAFTINTAYDSPQAAGTVALNFAAYNAASASLSEVQIDGRPHTTVSPSREFPNLLPGINVRLGENTVAGEQAVISVDVDQAALVTGVHAFLTAYNTLVETLYRITRPPSQRRKPRNEVEAREQAAQRERTFAGTSQSSQAQGGHRAKKDAMALLEALLGREEEARPEGIEALERDTFVKSLYEAIQMALGNPITGVSEYGSLADIGFSNEVDQSGRVDPAGAQAIDSDIFSSAIAAAPMAVATLFAGSIVGKVQGVYQSLELIFKPPAAPGDPIAPDTVPIQIRMLIGQLQDYARLLQAQLREQVERKERYQASLRAKFIDMEKKSGQRDIMTNYLSQVADAARGGG